MTANQIRYAEHKENVRHNKTSEGETKRHNVASEGIGRTQASAAMSQAGASWAGVAESSRHNREQESINWFQTQNQGDYWGQLGTAAISQANSSRIQATSSARQADTAQKRQQEDVRHNTAVERETSQHNTHTEVQGYINAASGLAKSIMPIVGFMG